jgi:hypothetical protein
MKKFLSVMLGLALVLGATTMVASANDTPEKHDKKEEHKDPKGDPKPEPHKPDHK